MALSGYIWGVANLLLAFFFYLVWPAPESSYTHPLLRKSVRFILRWFPGTAWLFLAASFIFRHIPVLPSFLRPEWFGYTGFALFFLTVVTLVYDRSIASGAMAR